MEDQLRSQWWPIGTPKARLDISSLSDGLILPILAWKPLYRPWLEIHPFSETSGRYSYVRTRMVACSSAAPRRLYCLRGVRAADRTGASRQRRLESKNHFGTFAVVSTRTKGLRRLPLSMESKAAPRDGFKTTHRCNLPWRGSIQSGQDPIILHYRIGSVRFQRMRNAHKVRLRQRVPDICAQWASH
jgi:hypothetical protein